MAYYGVLAEKRDDSGIKSNIDIESNIDVESNIVLATPWNEFRYGLLHRWWILRDRIIRVFTDKY